MNKQDSLDKGEKKQGKWVLAEYEKDESFKNLEIGETLIGTFVARDTNYLKKLFYIIELEDGKIRKLNDTTNLHKWMAKIEPGDKIKITRKKDKNIPAQPNPLQIYEVHVWKKES